MVFRFLLLSDEVENFKREIRIASDATFYDLYEVIIDSVGYKKDEICSFFTCDEKWNKEVEITLMDMGLNTSSEEDSYIMGETVLENLLEDEHQRLLFVFDMLGERAFFMELREIILGENLDEPICSKSVGDAPQQCLNIEQVEEKTAKVNAKNTSTDYNLEDDFYGENSYNKDELNNDSFVDLDSLY